MKLSAPDASEPRPGEPVAAQQRLGCGSDSAAPTWPGYEGRIQVHANGTMKLPHSLCSQRLRVALAGGLRRTLRARAAAAAHRRRGTALLILVFGIIVPLDRSGARASAPAAPRSAPISPGCRAWRRRSPRSAPPPSATGESLLVIIDRSARESGLASALAGSEPGSAGSLSIRLEKAPFDALIALARAAVAAERRAGGLGHHREGRRAGAGERCDRAALGLK